MFVVDLSLPHAFSPFPLSFPLFLPPLLLLLNQAFFRKIASNRAPTPDIIQSFNPKLSLLPNICSICLSTTETTDHLFMHCPFTYSLWVRIFQLSTFPMFFLGSDWPHFPLQILIFGSFGILVSRLSYGPYGRKWIDGFLITLLGTSLQCRSLFYFL